MKLLLIADSFPPLRNSGAIQLRDLCRELVRQGHAPTVLLPTSEIEDSWRIEEFEGVRLVRLKCLRTKDVNYLRRFLGELAMPFIMLCRLRKTPLVKHHWEGVIWYSPSIFLGAVANSVRKRSQCKGYLIIRDIFPEWAVELGIMKKGLAYWFLSAVANYQYSVADVIGVQSPGNLSYFNRRLDLKRRRVEVLPNWLGKTDCTSCSIRLSQTALRGRRILVYAGNMGVAQCMDIWLDLAERMRGQSDVGFLFVGRGSDVSRLRSKCESLNLSNVLFFDEIDPDEIPDLYSQCSAGIISLDPRHKSHNIPGKFLTYMQSGLPALACINSGNDLAGLIRRERVGQVCESHNIDEMVWLCNKLLHQIECDLSLSARCKLVFEREFSAAKAAYQIVSALRPVD